MADTPIVMDCMSRKNRGQRAKLSLTIAVAWEKMAIYKETKDDLRRAENYWRMAAGYYSQAGHTQDAIRTRNRAKELKILLDNPVTKP